MHPTTTRSNANRYLTSQNNQRTIPTIPLVTENQTELDENARALTTMEHLPNRIHDALDQVVNPTTDHRIPNQERILQPELHISQLSIQRTKEQLQRTQTELTPTTMMPPPTQKSRKGKSSSSSSSTSTPKVSLRSK